MDTKVLILDEPTIAQDMYGKEQAMKTSTIYGIFLGAIFLAVFCLLGTNLAGVFLHDESLIHRERPTDSIIGTISTL